MYLEVIQEGKVHNMITVFPVVCKEEAAEIAKTIRKYHVSENLSINLKEKGKIINFEVEEL